MEKLFVLLCVFIATLHCSGAQSGSRESGSSDGGVSSGSGSADGSGEISGSGIDLLPGPPTNVQALILGSTAIWLSWLPPINDSNPVTGYQVIYTNGQLTFTRFTSANLRTVFISGLEPGVTYLFSVAALNSAGRSRFASINVTIPAVTIGFEFSSYTTTEGFSSRVCVVVRNGRLDRTITLQLSTAPSPNSETPATAGVDYTSIPSFFVSGRLTLSRFTTIQCLFVRTRSDSFVEGTEDFLVQLRAISFLPSTVELARTNATVFIRDNDVLEIGFELFSYTANEEADFVRVCAVITRGFLQTSRLVRVTLNTRDGTATAPDDYNATSVELTFSRTLTRACARIDLVDDEFHDNVFDSMFFWVILETNDSIVFLRRSSAQVNILENDVLVIGLERESYTVTESIRLVTVSSSGNTSEVTVVQQTSVEVCAVVLNGTIQENSSANAFVRFSTQSFTATGGSSGTAACTEGNVRLVGSSRPREGRVEICFNGVWGTVCDDGWSSQDAAVVCRQLGHSSVGASARFRAFYGRGTGPIWLDDVRCTGAEFRLADCRHLGIGVTRSCSHFEDAGVVCRANPFGGDFVGFTGRQVAISENGTGCVSVQVRDDSITEGPEQFFVTLSASFGSAIIIQQPSRATVTILDDGDVAVFGFTRTEYFVTEGGRVFVSLTVLQGSLENILLNVQVNSMDGSATNLQDYQPLNTTVTTARFFTFPISTIEDGVDEDPETFFLRLELVEDTDISIQLSPGEAVVTILDDDRISVGLVDTDYSVPENAGMVEICVVLLEGALERTANVTLSTIDGSAIAPADYSAISIVLTFDESVSRSCGSIPIELDNTTETEEFFSVAITTTDPDITLVTETARVTITDQSDVIIGFETVAYEVNEGQNQVVELCVAVRGGSLETPVEITLVTEDGTALAPDDYAGASLRIVFTEEDDDICTQIPIVNDMFAESTERFFATLATQDLRISLLPATASISIVDDDSDDEPVTVRFVDNTPSVDGNTVTVAFAVGAGVQTLMCSVTTQPTQDCSSGRITYTLPSRAFPFEFTVTAGGGARSFSLTRDFRIDTIANCWLHLINDGVTVNKNSVTIEWEGTGPDATANPYTVFNCRLDGGASVICSSPYQLTGLTPGSHEVRISTRDTGNRCNRELGRVVEFLIE